MKSFVMVHILKTKVWLPYGRELRNSREENWVTAGERWQKYQNILNTAS
jgi:hypothetical protein